MKITKQRLKKIIKEEVEKVVKEGLEDSEAGSRHYQNVKRKERILKKAIKDGLTFDQVQGKYTEFYDLDPEYYKHLKTEKPDEALEEASILSPRLEVLFGEGAPGHNFAEALATALMLDEENDFQAMIQAIKDGLENWYQSRTMS